MTIKRSKWQLILKYVRLHVEYAKTGNTHLLDLITVIYSDYIVLTFGEQIESSEYYKWLVNEIPYGYINYTKLANDLYYKCYKKYPSEKELKVIVATLMKMPKDKMTPNNLKSIINTITRNKNRW